MPLRTALQTLRAKSMQGDYVRTQLLVTYVVTQQQSVWLPLIYNY